VDVDPHPLGASLGWRSLDPHHPIASVDPHPPSTQPRSHRSIRISSIQIRSVRLL